MRIQLDESVRTLGIDKVYVLECGQLEGTADGMSVLEEVISTTVDDLRSAANNESPFATSFRDLLARMGHPETEPAGVKMNRRVRESGIMRVTPLVDSYNLVAAKYSYGIGAHDAALLDPQVPIIVRRATGNEVIVPLARTKSKRIPAGDLIYAQNDQVIAWLGKQDVDSDHFKITEKTHCVLFILLGRHDIGDDLMQAVADEIRIHVGYCFPDTLARCERVWMEG